MAALANFTNIAAPANFSSWHKVDLAGVPGRVVEKHPFIDGTWRNLLLNPKDETSLASLVEAVETEPDKVFEHLSLVKDTVPGHFKRFMPLKVGSWANSIHNQYCHPEEIRDITGVQDIISAVKFARGDGLKIRAAGSGHSFSNVVPVYDDKSVLLTTHNMKKSLPTPSGSLKNNTAGMLLYSVESGITIKELNERLDAAGLALTNMGAYDGQTLAGAISTGTHGSGIKLGPIASAVRSMTVVTQDGEVLQLEPKDGITDPAKFKSDIGAKLRQDDDYFYSSVVAMGCLGVIYSYTIEVEKLYYLTETRKLTTWETIKKDLVPRPGQEFPDIIANNRHFELLLNPYVVNGVNTAVTVVRNKSPDNKQVGSRGFMNWLSGLLAQWKLASYLLVGFLNMFPATSPGTIDSALKTLPDEGYVDKSYIVLNLGDVDKVPAFAVELHFDVKDLIPQVERIFGYFQQAAKDMNWYIAGPVALRFTAASPALIASEAGRATCTAELDMLVGINTGMELLKHVKQNAVKDSPSVRVHWGLDLDTVGSGEFNKNTYPNYDRWMKVYRDMNSAGLFNSPLTDRLGISV